MDLIALRIIATVVSFAVFLAIIWWAYGGAQAKRFAEAARLPFEEDDALYTPKVVSMHAHRHAGASGQEDRT